MKNKAICIFVVISMLVIGCASQPPTESQTPSDTTVNENHQVDNLEHTLDYSQGIADGIYGWTLSEDGSYYMLSAINEDGTPVESIAEQNFMRGGQGGMKGMDGEHKEMGQNQENPESAGEKKFEMKRSHGTTDDPLAMEQNDQASTQSVNAQGVYTESNITNSEYQTMLVFVPTEYMTINEDGSASFTDAVIGGYTAETAPIVFQNSNGGWRSGTPKAPEYADTLSAGMIYVSCGSRSRDAMTEDGAITGKAPIPVADLKAGVIALRANADVIPGDKERIISVGASGGGQMSSALGATGNMEEYYPYLYEAGAIGVTYDEATGTYSSEYDDSVYAAMAYCPIADIENADLAYAWLCYDSTLNKNGTLSETAGYYEFTDFQLALQEDAAYAFAEYINSLNLIDENGTKLSFPEKEDGTLDLREGTYYNAILQNISDALNATLAVQNDATVYITEKYGEDTSDWLTEKEDGTYQVISLANFINSTGLVRNKDIPGFDTLDMSAENDAFGTSDTKTVHYSASIAQLLKDNYETYESLEGFEAKQIDLYIQNALTGDEAKAIAEQTYLVNGTQIMLDVATGIQEADIAKYWRTRNGTADQHTSFSVAYNICIAAQMAGAKADYSLVWAMGHSSNEGTTTGTLVDWINEICMVKQ